MSVSGQKLPHAMQHDRHKKKDRLAAILPKLSNILSGGCLGFPLDLPNREARANYF
jgi:hypothetical protein